MREALIMPWRNRYIAPRRHPMALSGYGVIFLLGLLFIVGVFQSAVVDELLGSSVWRICWEWLLTIGGGLGFLGAQWRGDLDTALWMERLGATTSVFGLLLYAGAITDILGFSASTWLLLGVLALGCFCRAWQITVEMRRVKSLLLRGPE